jgi:hypothetical protein
MDNFGLSTRFNEAADTGSNFGANIEINFESMLKDDILFISTTVFCVYSDFPSLELTEAS